MGLGHLNQCRLIDPTSIVYLRGPLQSGQFPSRSGLDISVPFLGEGCGASAPPRWSVPCASILRHFGITRPSYVRRSGQRALAEPFLWTYIAALCMIVHDMDINKDLVAASATPLVLAILAERESYGYAILKRVSELSAGRLEWSDGMLYPVLHRLERLGYIAGKWQKSESERRRRYYRITPQGKQQLAAERRQWQAVDAALRNVWSLMALRTAPPAWLQGLIE
jgi:PadR family transcriptional regulator, regulatory protein PadR